MLVNSCRRTLKYKYMIENILWLSCFVFFFTFNESSGDQSVQGQNKLYKSLLAAFCAPCHLGTSWDAAGMTESIVSQSGSVAAAHLCFHQCGTSLSSSGGVHETSRTDRALLTVLPFTLLSWKEEKKTQTVIFTHLTPPPPLPTLSICFWMDLKSWQLCTKREREREMRQRKRERENKQTLHVQVTASWKCSYSTSSWETSYSISKSASGFRVINQSSEPLFLFSPSALLLSPSCLSNSSLVFKWGSLIHF